MYYTYHFDYPNQKWNCFEVVDGHEIYICSFATVGEAIAWCQNKSYRDKAAAEFSSAAREVNHAG